MKHVKVFASVAALTLLAFGLMGCAPEGSGGSSGAAASGGKPLTIGFIYVGSKDDYGYNQAHADGAAAVKKMPGVKVLEVEKVPETVDVQKTMKSMIEDDGAKLIFPTSYGYFDPHVRTVAKEYPEVEFLHCGGLWVKDKDPENLGTYFGYIDEPEYLSGVVAAYATKSKKLGFVAAKPIPQVRRNINAFTMGGVRSVDPSITCNVIFTGDWSMPIKEAEAATSLIGQGVDVLTCHVDSPKVVIETAERRGIHCTGYHVNQAVAPNGYLAGAEWNWEKVYTDYVNDVKAGKKIPHLLRGGLKEGIVKTSPYGKDATEEAKKKADEIKAKFMDGSFVIFKGPLKDNTGKEVIGEGKVYGQTAIELESMNYLVEGVVGE